MDRMTGVLFDTDGKKYLYWRMSKEQISKMPIFDAIVVTAGIDAEGFFKGWLNGRLTYVELAK